MPIFLNGPRTCPLERRSVIAKGGFVSQGVTSTDPKHGTELAGQVTSNETRILGADQAADRNSRLRILVTSSTRFIFGISSRSTAA